MQSDARLRWRSASALASPQLAHTGFAAWSKVLDDARMTTSLLDGLLLPAVHCEPTHWTLGLVGAAIAMGSPPKALSAEVPMYRRVP
jgi:hypothetical protein